MNGSSESMGLTVAASPSTGHRTQALRLADREQEALEDNARRAFSDVDGLISSPGSSFQTLGAMSDISEGATLLGAMGSHLEDGSSDKAAALKAKRKCERLRKKATKDIIGAGTQRRVEFVGRSLKVAQEDFAIEDTIHSEQGVDIPLADADGRIWAVILGEPKGWDTRRKGIRAARDRLERQTAHLAVHPNRRGDFQSFNYGFSFGNGRTNPMNFVNGPTVQAALTEFYEDEHVQAMFLYAESES
ncbi:hypothetical protein FS837_010476 [Tulasnella sp. UAMH 9824]|nr:hypothetical protein FS837_010476 [Tulasnella sp. UAMH 9824]